MTKRDQQDEFGFDLGKLRQLRPSEAGTRFFAGALTSLFAGLIGLANEPIGGLFLAFPAILVAGLTLVERKENTAAARKIAHGSVAGGFGLIAFALTAIVTLETLPAPAALGAAFAAWSLVTACTYAVIQTRSR